MNFYGKNYQQDKYFIEIRSSLELIYWVASDLDHFVENYPELIDKKVLDIIFSNSIKLKNFFYKTKDKINILKGIHKKCAISLANYTEFCIEEFDYVQKKSKEEESEDITFSRIIDADINYRDQFEKYYLKTDVEFYRSKAFRHLSIALSELIDFTVYIGNKSDLSLAENKRLNAIKHLSSADTVLKIGSRLMELDDTHTRDFFIACSENTEISMEFYNQLQVDFNLTLSELFFVQSNFYTQFDKGKIPEESEVKLVDYETAKYYGQLNKIGFDISKIILNIMNKEIPQFSLLSPLAIKNQLDFINVK